MTMKERRIGLGLTQQQVADMAHIAREHYTMIEAGQRNPSVGVLYAIADALQCSADDLRDGVQKMNNTNHANHQTN